MKKKNKFKPVNSEGEKSAVREEKVAEVRREKKNETKSPVSQQEDVYKPSTIKEVLKVLRSNIPIVFVLIVICFAVYWQVVRGEFLNIDDLAGIVQNPNIRDLKTAFNTGYLYQLYTALIFKFFGLNSTAYHVMSIILHIFNCVLVFLFTYMLFGKRVSIITTALFSVNPTGAEAINWLSASGYLHQTAVSIITLMLFTMYRRSKDSWYLISCVVLYGLNLWLYRTAWGMVTPFLIILIDLLLLNPDITVKKAIRHIPVYLPFIILSLIFTYIQIIRAFQERAYTLETQHYLSIKSATPYLNRIPYSIFMIGRQYIYPERLTIYHEGRIIGNVEYTIMIISSLIFIALCIYLLRKNKTYAALLLLIFSTTLPSFSPVAIAWLVAERYLYFGTFFYCILLAKLLIDIEKKTKLRNAVKVFGTIIFIIFFTRTFVRADNFSTSKKLWLNTMKAAPLSYRVYNNLGDVYANEGQYDLAIQNFTRSIELKPDYADAVHNMGFTYMQKGDVNKARYYLQKSFEMNPRLYQSLFKLGYIELQLGNLDGAKYYFQKTLEVNPGNAEATQLLNSIIQTQSSLVNPVSSPASQ
jgi:hypothetical protein